jgi:hypothetical protein
MAAGNKRIALRLVVAPPIGDRGLETKGFAGAATAPDDLGIAAISWGPD